MDNMTRARLRKRYVLQVTTLAKNLGIIPDSKLSWKDFISKIKTKTIKSLGVLSTMVGST